jgi:putative ABC transport system permease protein
VITSQDGYTPFVASAGEAARDAQGAQVVTDVRTDLAELAGSDRYLTGIDPERITAGYAFEWKDGSDAVLGQLGRNGAIVAEEFADDKKLAVGDSFAMRTAGGATARFVVKGIYKPPPFYPLLGSVSIPTQTFDSLYERKRNQYTFVNVAGEPTEAGKRAIEAAVNDYPDARVQTRAEWIEKEDQEFQQFLSLLYVLLALSVVVSIFGIVNTLVLSVFERTRELGMLRAVGMTRRQVRRMVRHESVITALIGASLGLPLGVFLAALMTRALDQFDVQFVVPTGQLVLLAVVAVIVGMLAAILPARRAARLNVLQALQYE